MKAGLFKQDKKIDWDGKNDNDNNLLILQFISINAYTFEQVIQLSEGSSLCLCSILFRSVQAVVREVVIVALTVATQQVSLYPKMKRLKLQVPPAAQAGFGPGAVSVRWQLLSSIKDGSAGEDGLSRETQQILYIIRDLFWWVTHMVNSWSPVLKVQYSQSHIMACISAGEPYTSPYIIKMKKTLCRGSTFFSTFLKYLRKWKHIKYVSPGD